MTVYDSLDEAMEAGKHIFRRQNDLKTLYCPHTEEEISVCTLYNFCPVCGIDIGGGTTVTHPEDDYWVSGFVPI